MNLSEWLEPTRMMTVSHYRSKMNVWLAGTLLIVAAWLALGPVLQNAFVNFDDDIYVYKNPHVTSGFTAENVRWAFTQVHSSNWHPVTWMSHMLDCQLFGLNPWGHHLVNLLLHLISTLLLWGLLRQMTGALWRSTLVAAAFAVHPLRVESVSWVAERKDVLSGVFFLLTLWTYVRFATTSTHSRRTGIIWYVFCLIIYSLGLMSKPMLVTVPGVLWLLDFWPLKRMTNSDEEPFTRFNGTIVLRRLLWEKLPFIILSGLACLITMRAQAEAISPQPLALRLGNAVVTYATYLQQLIYPVNLAVFYPYPTAGLPMGKIIAAAAVLVTFSLLVWQLRRQHPWLLMGWLWYLGMLLPVIGILQAGAQAHADRYTYLPQIGLLIGLVWSASSWIAARHWSWPVPAGSAVATLTALLLMTRHQAGIWKNSETLWTHSLACTADSVTAHINLGNALLERNAPEAAKAHYQIALQLEPNNPDALVSLGYILVREGRLTEATPRLQQALKLNPNHAEAHNDLGNILAQEGHVEDAITHFQTALKLQPDYAEAHYNLGNALFQRGEFKAAASQFVTAHQLNPSDAHACFNLGNTYFQMQALEAAIRCYRQALQLQPDYVKASYNLGMALGQKGDLTAAIAELQRTLRLQPDNAEASYSLGNFYLQTKAATAAATYLQKAVQTNPNWAEAHYNLGLALLAQERLGEAVAQFQQALDINPEYADALNNLAWALATGSPASLRDGHKAVELAEHANRLAGGRDIDVLDTLAAAYAEAGRFEEARHTVVRALELARQNAQPDQSQQLMAELKLYEAGQPFHQGDK